jgi:hypothetical protein
VKQVPLVVMAAALMTGCSAQQLYGMAQGWQHQECQRIADRDERQRCERSSAVSYEQYRREREAAKAGTPTQ